MTWIGKPGTRNSSPTLGGTGALFWRYIRRSVAQLSVQTAIQIWSKKLGRFLACAIASTAGFQRQSCGRPVSGSATGRAPFIFRDVGCSPGSAGCFVFPPHLSARDRGHGHAGCNLLRRHVVTLAVEALEIRVLATVWSDRFPHRHNVRIIAIAVRNRHHASLSEYFDGVKTITTETCHRICKILDSEGLKPRKADQTVAVGGLCFAPDVGNKCLMTWCRQTPSSPSIVANAPLIQGPTVGENAANNKAIRTAMKAPKTTKSATHAILTL